VDPKLGYNRKREAKACPIVAKTLSFFLLDSKWKVYSLIEWK